MAKYIITEEQVEDLRIAIETAISWHYNCDNNIKQNDQEMAELRELGRSICYEEADDAVTKSEFDEMRGQRDHYRIQWQMAEEELRKLR